MARPVLTRFTPSNTTILVCDMQERFSDKIYQFKHVTKMSEKLLSAAAVFSIPIATTEQNPKAFGPTVEPLKKFLHESPIPKTAFSMAQPALLEDLRRRACNHVALIGIEAHICVLHSALDFIRAGLNVHVMADAVSSCNFPERQIALNLVRDSGGYVTTTESFIFGLLSDATNPKAKTIFGLVKDYSEDTKLAVNALCG
ncbi:hypothetical protein CROQUDRAFT_650743 [Cronartium quercuum f. sp. fusiforme G11]|uniref:Isochorismatase-like domain-containing protein n=1 Tax=Cronartium quercuum f. sp. fusiforme G11 TaxID=708437 RepID=A0A9P6NYG1_9BASI|nr:hypothetical protein CROQUDRAFT_650743 [Cronartium quercuum f. sp. fusiforme G11]